jgi:hypothetical protein
MKGFKKTKKLFYRSMLYLKHSSPAVLTCLGAIGVAATAAMAVKATPRAMDTIRTDSRQNHDGDPYAYTKFEAVKSCWMFYIPSALIGISTISCIFGANVLNKRNQASLVSAYALLSKSYQHYKEAANSVYGEDADLKIKAQMAKDVYVSADGYSVHSQDLDSESEKILCYDLFSERYFMTTMASVLNAQYHINRNLTLRGEVRVNEFYEFLGIESIDCGDDVGWSMDELLEGGIMWLDFENIPVETVDGLECCIISTVYNPIKLL